MLGAQTDDRYHDVRLLGSGGMGTVTLAEDTELGRLVALKRVHAAGDPQGLTRLRREALIGASLNHPNLVAVYDVLTEGDGDLTIVMEFVDGHTLRDLIRAGPMRPARAALHILRELASGLDVIHAQSIVHRDVKPANVLLGTDGAVKLADLGIAAVGERTQITTAGAVVGTFGYMAPEQLDGRKSDPAVDIYALSAVAFEMLSGRKARPEPNPLALAHAISTQPPPDLRDQWPEAPAQAAAVLRQGMAFDPRERPRSARELVDRLGMALEPAAGNGIASATRSPRAASSATPEAASAPASARTVAPGPRRDPVTSRPPPPGRSTLAGSVHSWPPVADRPGSGTGRGPHTAARRHRRNRWVGLAALGAVVIAAGALVAAVGSGGVSHRSRTLAATRAGAKATRGRVRAPTPGPGSGAPAASASSGASGPVTVRATATASGAPTSAATPTGAVESFYATAARHDYAAAWRLADANLRNQLLGYSSFQSQMSVVRSITFRQAETLPGASRSSATVAVQTTSRQIGSTQRCAGTVRTLRSSGAVWLLDRVAITCSP